MPQKKKKIIKKQIKPRTVKKTVKKRTTRKAAAKKNLLLKDLIGGAVIMGIGLFVLNLSVTLLGSTGPIPLETKQPVVLGDNHVMPSAPLITETATPPQLDEVAETVTPCCGAQMPPVEEENLVEEADPVESAIQPETPEEPEAVAEKIATPILDTMFCSNYSFHQLDLSSQDPSHSSIILREKEKNSAVTLIEDVSVFKQRDGYHLHLLTQLADNGDCRLLFFTEVDNQPKSPKEGLFSYDIQTGEFKELNTSDRFKGFSNFQFNEDFSHLIVVHDNQELDDTGKTLEVINLPEDTTRIMVRLEGNETFNAGGGFGGFSGNFGWQDDQKTIFYYVYEDTDGQVEFMEQRTVALE